VSDPRFLQYALHLDGAAVPGFVRGFTLREALSEGFEGEVEVESDDAPPAARLGCDATLEVTSADGDARSFHGVLRATSVRSAGRGRALTRYTLSDRAFSAALGRDHRIVQERSVPDIAREVLAAVGVPAAKQRWTLRATYAPRGYTVQFGESDRAFLARLLADEGIAWAVWSDDDGDLFHFFDDPSALEPVAGEQELVDRRATAGRAHTVLSLEERRRGESDAIFLRDYDPTQPSTDLSATERAPRATGREVYTHPGGFRDAGLGRRRAQRALQRLQCGTRVFAGRTDAPQLMPGRWFRVTGHPRASMNLDLLVVEVTHHGRAEAEGTAYENRVTAIPREVPYRPPVAPQPVMGGVHVARVTGPAGTELWGSASGQVKVRFPWDESGRVDDRSSCWLRVGQLALGGPMLIPRVGFEVLVDHELGDLDRPVVVGHLYNGEQPPPYELPAQSVVSSLQTATTQQGGGANELRTTDTAGAEEMFFNASHDMNVRVENNASWSVGANQSLTVGANHALRVGADAALEVVGNRSVSVGGNQSTDALADVGDGIGGDLTLTVGATRQVTVGGDHTEETTGALSRTVGALQCVTGVAGYSRTIAGASSTTVGGVLAVVCARSVGSSCDGTRIETVGALKLVKAKTVAVNCGAAYAQQCVAQTAVVGGARTDSAAAIVMNVGGGVRIKAADVNITGESKVVLRVGGTTIEVKPGSVTIKSSRIDLKGAKRLKSLQHKTN
jgi:type VI secretion system secreted protein VgrG